MPLVRIDVSKSSQAGLARAIGERVYRAMHEEINVPENDHFQILSTHEADELVRPAQYLGVEYSDGLVFIQITLNQGRTTELKKRLYRRIAQDVSTELGLRIQDIFISLLEVDKENWSFGNGDMQYGPKS